MLLTASIALTLTAAVQPSCISSGGSFSLSVCISPATGTVESLRIAVDGEPLVAYPFDGGTLSIDGCTLASPPSAVTEKDGSILITHRWCNCSASAAGVDVTHRLSAHSIPASARAPAFEGLAERAAVRVVATLAPVSPVTQWSAPVTTRFGFGASSATRRVWMAVGQPPVSERFDPLAPWEESQSPPSMVYGGVLALPDIWSNGKKAETFDQPGGLALPAVTWIEEQPSEQQAGPGGVSGQQQQPPRGGGRGGWGLTLVLNSPGDVLVHSILNVTHGTGAGVDSSRYAFYRTGARFTSAPSTFSSLYILHAPCWRPALAAMRDEFPTYFYPHPKVDTSAFDGLMAYADYRGENDGPTANTSIPFETLARTGLKTNWDASFPQQGGGHWLGPGTAEWTTCYPHYDNPVPSGGERACRTASYRGVEGAYSGLSSHGISTLTYGNLFMFGWAIQPFDSPTNFSAACSPLPSDPFQRINCSLNLEFREEWADAALFTSDTDTQIVFECSSARCGLAVVDPGTPAYRRLMLQEHRKQVEKTPSMAGVAFDEQQYLGAMNTRRDDGVGWYAGRPAASLLRSFIDVTASLATEVLHPAGKGLLVNTHVYRLDMLAHMDGILDEYGDYPAKMNTNAILGLAMPVLAWDHCGGTVASQRDAPSCATDHSTFDEFLGQHLYLGVQPMGPFVNQSHGVLPSEAHTRMFEDWGPLFKAIRNKQWLLSAHAVAVRPAGADGKRSGSPPLAGAAAGPYANIFAVGASRVAVAAVAGGAEPEGRGEWGASPQPNATLELAPLGHASWEAATASALLPGAVAPVPLGLQPLPSGGTVLVTPLHRGAALVVIELAKNE